MTGMRTKCGVRTAAGTAAVAIVAGLSGPTVLQAQEAPAFPSPAEAEAAATGLITALFDAMRASDAEAMRGLFAADVPGFPSSFATPEGPTVRFGGLDGFLGSVGGAEPGSLDEQFVVRDIMVDDNLVTVITPYTFTYQGNFSHCGIDVFLIARIGAEWKIIGLADTRRRDGCDGWLDE